MFTKLVICMGWAKDFKKIIAKQKLDAEKLFVAASIQGMNTAMIRSPVGNPDLWHWNHPQFGYVDYLAYRDAPDGYVGGQFRANWRFSISGVDSEIKDRTNFSVVPAESKAVLSGFKFGMKITFSNPMPYGPRLEFDQWSTQAPDGIARPSVEAVKKALKRKAT